MKKTFVILLTFVMSNCFSQTAEDSYNKAKKMQDIGDYYSAIDYFSKAIDIDQTYESYLNRGICYRGIKNWKRAEVDF